jgi:1-acyl-sn-glycerol-3-phosphate acyltransferase
VPSIVPDWASILDRLVDDEIEDRISRMGIQVNAFGYDRWGFSPRDARRALALVRWFYRHYFRVEVHGIDNVPPGRVLLIGNHSGQLAYDGMLVAGAMALDAEPPRQVRAMIERFFALVPGVSIMMTRLGQLTGTPRNAARLLADEDAAVLVFPEGERGGGRVWRDRYKVLGFGQGFMRMALETEAPIVPFGFIGGEEMAASLSRMKPLARLLGTPYVPLSPTLVPLPLPVKVRIHFGEPLRFFGAPDDEDEVVLGKVAEVEAAVDRLIQDGLAQRRGVFR